MPINPLFSGLLWAAYLFCLLLSGVQSPYPATAVTGVYTTPGTGLASTNYFRQESPISYTNIASNYHLIPTASAGFANTPQGKIFSTDGTLRASVSQAYQNIMVCVLKETLIFGLARDDNEPWRWFYSMQVIGSTFGMTLIKQDTSSTFGVFRSLNEPATDYVYYARDNLYKLSVYDPGTNILTSSPSPRKDIANIVRIDKLDAIVHGRKDVSLLIIHKADFSTIKNPTFTGPMNIWVVDNLNNQDFIYTLSTTGVPAKADRTTWLTNSDLIVTTTISAYGAVNTIMNFGAYQYILSIPETAPPPLVFINKISLAVQATSLTIGTRTARFSSPYTIERVENRYYVYMIQDSNLYFQSYYITANDYCQTRDAISHKCTTCVASNYMTSADPWNICAPLAEVERNKGVDTQSQSFKPCITGTGCISCTLDYTKCSLCDVNSNYYLLNDMCYAYASIPDGYGISTPGQQALGPCIDTGCKNCTGNPSVCRACKSAQGFYFQGSACIHYSVVSGNIGGDLISGNYTACADSLCRNCSANYQACSLCDQVNGYISVNGSCKMGSSNIKISNSQYLKNKDIWTIEFTGAIIASLASECLLDMLVLDKYEDKMYSCKEIECELAETKPSGFSIRFISKYSLRYGTAKLLQTTCFTLKDSKSKADIMLYPIEVDFTSMGPPSTSIVLASISTTTMNSVGFMANLALMKNSLRSAIKFDIISTEIVGLLVVAGPPIAAPDEILLEKYRQGPPLPFNFDNPFASWSKMASCSLPDSFSRNDLVCSIFGNYGEGLIVMGASLAINILVSVSVAIAFVLLQRQIAVGRYAGLKICLELLRDTIGINFTLAKLEGNQLELLIFGLANLAHTTGESAVLAGSIISCLLMMYYVGCLVVQVFLANLIWNQI